MIMSGGLLMERDALRPRCFEVETGSHPNGWIFLKQTQPPRQLENELSATGWTFFFMAGPIGLRMQSRENSLRGAESLHRGRKTAEMQLSTDRKRGDALLPGESVCERVSPPSPHPERRALRRPADWDEASITAHERGRNATAT
jgi:hypothetical protein